MSFGRGPSSSDEGGDMLLDSAAEQLVVGFLTMVASRMNKIKTRRSKRLASVYLSFCIKSTVLPKSRWNQVSNRFKKIHPVYPNVKAWRQRCGAEF